MKFVVRAYFNDFGNHEPAIIVGQVRRLADELGYHGIVAKRRQTNERILQRGYLRIVLPTRRLARRYQELVVEFWGHLVTTKRFMKRMDD